MHDKEIEYELRPKDKHKAYRGRTYAYDNIVLRVSAKSCAYDLERRRKFRLCDWSNLTLAKRDWPNW